MPRDPIDDALVRLTRTKPTYEELRDVREALYDVSPGSPEENVERYALVNCVEEMLSYLDSISEGLAKSFGLPRRDECERIFDELEYPAGVEPVDRVDDLLTQWQNVSKYSLEDVTSNVGAPR